MNTSSANDFTELPSADRALVIRQLEALLERLLSTRLQEAIDVRFRQRQPSGH
jgi:hypothetical protein